MRRTLIKHMCRMLLVQAYPDLQSICSNLVGEPNASAFLLQINNEAARVFLDVVHCQLQLIRAVAFQGAQHLCKNLALNPGDLRFCLTLASCTYQDHLQAFHTHSKFPQEAHDLFWLFAIPRDMHTAETFAVGVSDGIIEAHCQERMKKGPDVKHAS